MSNRDGSTSPASEEDLQPIFDELEEWGLMHRGHDDNCRLTIRGWLTYRILGILGAGEIDEETAQLLDDVAYATPEEVASWASSS